MQLTSRCPSLKHVRIRPALRDNTIQDANSQRIMSETILRLSSLKTLECDALNDAAIVHLSQLPSLTKLLMHLQGSQLETLRPYFTPPAFASLECLLLKVDTLSTSTSLLGAMDFKLRKLLLVADGSPIQAIPHALHSCSTALVKACDFERLSSIALDIGYDRWLPGVERQEVSLSTFQPLLSLPNVDNFIFNAMCNISFDDDAIKTLTKHWPKLACLALNPDSGWGAKSRVTHRGLITLLSSCPNLARFKLAVDFSEIDQSHSQLPKSRPGNGIISYCREVCLIESAINHPVTIAAFLSDICPRLDKLTSFLGEDADMMKYTAKWNEVKDLLPAFLAVRTQCNEWHKEGKESSLVDRSGYVYSD
ncbi:hypothetical protein JVU11DRAFT_5707 [Chiua virens]|nr:hypothetical protein JVU11DRAFT_5707 [Chiua virens]